MECRNGDAPWNLTAQVPVLDVVEVLNQGCLTAFRSKGDLSGLQSLLRGLSERFHMNEPLVLDERLDNAATLIAVTDRMLDRIFSTTQFGRFERGEDFLARILRG